MDQEKIGLALAALMYYKSEPNEKGEGKKKPVSFESLPEDERKPFLSLAESVLIQIDQLNLKVVPKAKVKNEAEIEALLRSRIESTVKDFFEQVKIWKKDLIPQAELAAKIYQIWERL